MFVCLSLILVGTQINAQAPAGMKYQAVLRDLDGKAMAGKAVSIKIEILQGSETGTAVFTETHAATTNAFGLANLNIGAVNPAGFAAIDWAAGPYFVKVTVDGDAVGTNQLLSVPYALYATSVANDMVNDADSDPTNELQNLAISGHDLSISNGNTVTLPDNVNDADSDPTNEIQTLSLSGYTLSLSGGGTVELPQGFNGSFLSLTDVPPI